MLVAALDSVPVPVEEPEFDDVPDTVRPNEDEVVTADALTVKLLCIS